MNEVNEYRVKPVIRWNLTHFHSQDVGPGLRNASVRSLGEFDSEQQANEARDMYERATVERQYAIVSLEFDIDAKVYYATSESEAEELRGQLQEQHGKDFRIFSRPKHDILPGHAR